MYPEIGSFDAKTKLSELLRAVQQGKGFTITLRGKPVANLVPISDQDPGQVESAIEAMRNFEQVAGVSAEEINDWVSEGRR